MPEEQAETFVVEPEMQLDGSPAPARTWLRPPSAGGKLTSPALVALAEGIALLVCFVLPPWYAFYAPLGPTQHGMPAVKGYSGWEMALGIPIGGAQRFDLFVHLWLVPLVAVALLVLA